MRLVDDDPAEVGENVPPALVVGKDPDVEHVGVGEDEVGAAADRRPIIAGGVAVVDRVAELKEAELRQLPRLILSESLGRVEIEGAPPLVADELIEHGKVERQRLARGGAAGDDHVAPAGRLESLELV